MFKRGLPPSIKSAASFHYPIDNQKAAVVRFCVELFDGRYVRNAEASDNVVIESNGTKTLRPRWRPVPDSPRPSLNRYWKIAERLEIR